jgi:hypothetical protein
MGQFSPCPQGGRDYEGVLLEQYTFHGFPELANSGITADALKRSGGDKGTQNRDLCARS